MHIGALGCRPTSQQEEDPARWRAETTTSMAEISGQERGNGMDFYAYEDGHAWFTDHSRMIRYCDQVAADFGVTEDFVKDELRDALSQWSAAADLYNRHQDNKVKIAHRYEALGSCDGSEDLRFIFGDADGAVRTMNFPKNKVAGAVPSSYDDQQGWGKGLVWITKKGSVQPRGRLSWSMMGGTTESWEDHKDFPNWSWAYNLKGILLHELGHINGWEHIPNTIMDENMYLRLIIKEDHVRKYMLGQISQYLDLDLTLNPWNFVVKGSLGMPFFSSPSAEHEELIKTLNTDYDKRREILFEKMTGRSAAGPVKATLQTDLQTQDEGCRYILQLTDASASHDLCIRQENGLIITDGPAGGGMALDIGSIFKVSKQDYFDKFNFVQSYSTDYSITTATGTKHLVSIDFNLTYFERLPWVSPIVIKWYDGLTAEVLFTAETPVPQFPTVRWKKM